MYRRDRPFLLTLLLLSIGLRTVFGAPCCMAWEAAAHAAEVPMEMASHDHDAHHDHHKHYAHHDHDMHQDKSGDTVSHDGHSHEAHASASNPCCSACGPTLPANTILLADRAQIKAPINSSPIRALQTRPPFPAYDARGPPLLT